MNKAEYILLSASAFVFGLFLGAYLGTLIWRIKTDTSYKTSKCFCPKCSHPLKLWEQIPVLGFFLVGGKCRYCNSKISIFYPLREFGSAIFYLITFLTLNPYPVIMIISWVLFPIVIIFISVRKLNAKCLKPLLNLLCLTGPYMTLIYFLCTSP